MLDGNNDKTKPMIGFTPQDETRNLTTGKIEIYEGGTDNLLETRELSSLTNDIAINESFNLDERLFYRVEVEIWDEGGLSAKELLAYPPIVNFDPSTFQPTKEDIPVTVKIWSPNNLEYIKFTGPFVINANGSIIIADSDFKDKCTSLPATPQGRDTTCSIVVSSDSSQL